MTTIRIYKVIGLMSGTSLDGLDLAYCHIWKTDNTWEFDIKKTKSVSYDMEMRSQLKNSIFLVAEELLILNNTYGQWLGQQALTFIKENNLEVDFIASHGHTTHHRPEDGLTYQIGSGQHLANYSGHAVICDFRTNDLSLGGQGAPLVPIGDELLFSQYDFCLNLGGISNISFTKDGKRIAYDIGLANMVLNHITQKIGLSYDKGGALASTGKVDQKMLGKLNALAYYQKPFPKSTGYEWFVEKVVPIVDGVPMATEDLLATSIQHICEQIAIQIKSNSSKDKSSLFVCGGGALNHFLIETLEQSLGQNIRLEIPSPTLIAFKEALVFAFMGVLRTEKEINVLSSVTGAESDSCSGVCFLPV
ncbi:MAG: anhydro-N-acetylmuramic acid kinase [Bacteroidota bacterium]